MKLNEGLQMTIDMVNGAVAHAQEVAATRAEKGQKLGAESRVLLTRLEESCEKLRGVLESQVDEDNELADAKKRLQRHEVTEKRGRGEPLTEEERKVWGEMYNEMLDQRDRRARR